MIKFIKSLDLVGPSLSYFKKFNGKLIFDTDDAKISHTWLLYTPDEKRFDDGIIDTVLNKLKLKFTPLCQLEG